MTTTRKRFPKGLRLDPDTSAISEEGEIKYDDSAKKIQYRDDSADRSVVSEDGTQTLQNKTIDATSATGNNTLSADSDDIVYDNATSGLTATNVKAAIDEVEGRVDTIEGATYVNSFNSRTGAVSPAASDYDANQVDYDGTTSGLVATDVQAAIDEVDGDLDTHIADTSTHGVSGAVVGTTDSQTLTNKTIDGDLNTISNLAHGAEVDNPSSGVHGVTGSVVGTTDSQTLTNKTIDGDLNTISNLAHGAEVDDPSSGVHGVTGSVVGTTDTQDLSNKTFTDPITLEEQASTPSTPAAGDKKLYPKTDGKLYTLDDAGNEVEVGSGGAGDADTIHLIEAGDLLVIGDVDLTGQNADFDGGGTITTSSLSLSTTGADLIKGDKVIKYDPNANGQNDYFGFTRAIPRGLRGRFLGFSFEFKNDSTTIDNDFRFCVKQKDGTSAGDIEYFDMEAFNNSDGNSKKFVVSSFIQSDCTEIEFGWQNTSTTTTVELYVDNVLVSSDPFTQQDVSLQQNLQYLENTTNFRNLGATSGFVQWSTSLVSSSFNGDNILSIVDGTNITEFHSSKDANVTVSFSVPISTVNVELHLYINGTLVSRGSSQYAANQELVTTFTFGLSAGDYFDFRTSNGTTALTSGASSYLHITASATQQSIITPAKVNLTEWQSFTSVFQGSTTNPTKGTIDYDEFHWRRVGDSMELHGSYRHTTAGTAGSGTYLLQIPEGLTIDTSKIYIATGSDNGVVGSAQFGAGENYGLALVYSTTQLSFSGGTSTTAAAPWSSTFTSNTFGDANVRFSFHARVPILEWANSSTEFLAAIPFSNWQSFTPTGSWTTNTTYTGFYRRVLDTIEIDVTATLSGAPNAATLTINIPFNLTMDTSKLSNPSQYDASLGSGVVNDTATAVYDVNVTYDTSTTVAPLICLATGAYTEMATITQTLPITFASGDTVQLKFSVPIEGWDV